MTPYAGGVVLGSAVEHAPDAAPDYSESYGSGGEVPGEITIYVKLS